MQQQYSLGYETTYLSQNDIYQINVIQNLEIDYANDDLFLDKLFRKYIGIEDAKMKQLYALRQRAKIQAKQAPTYTIPQGKVLKQRPASYVTYQLAKQQQKRNELCKSLTLRNEELHHKALQEVLYEEGRRRQMKPPPPPPRKVQKPVTYGVSSIAVTDLTNQKGGKGLLNRTKNYIITQRSQKQSMHDQQTNYNVQTIRSVFLADKPYFDIDDDKKNQKVKNVATAVEDSSKLTVEQLDK